MSVMDGLGLTIQHHTYTHVGKTQKRTQEVDEGRLGALERDGQRDGLRILAPSIDGRDERHLLLRRMCWFLIDEGRKITHIRPKTFFRARVLYVGVCFLSGTNGHRKEGCRAANTIQIDVLAIARQSQYAHPQSIDRSIERMPQCRGRLCCDRHRLRSVEWLVGRWPRRRSSAILLLWSNTTHVTSHESRESRRQ